MSTAFTFLGELELAQDRLLDPAFAGMADVFGMGSQPLPNVPYFGPWQVSGVMIGQGRLQWDFYC
jgi:hypothetical protein